MVPDQRWGAQVGPIEMDWKFHLKTDFIFYYGMRPKCHILVSSSLLRDPSSNSPWRCRMEFWSFESIAIRLLMLCLSSHHMRASDWCRFQEFYQVRTEIWSSGLILPTTARLITRQLKNLANNPKADLQIWSVMYYHWIMWTIVVFICNSASWLGNWLNPEV